MTLRGLIVAIVAFTLVCVTNSSSASAHGIFKKTLEKKYDNLRITCYMCHTKGEPKTTRNDFGDLFHQEMKEMELSKHWDEKEPGEERKEYETDVMAPAILEALEEIIKKENEDGEKYGDLIPNGEIEGSTIKD